MSRVVHGSFLVLFSLVAFVVLIAADYESFCEEKVAVGRYAISSDDLNCTGYIYCFYNSSSVFVGSAYDCPGALYFNATRALCVATQPTGAGCV